MTLSIDYLNARRDAKAASGGTKQVKINCERALAEAMSHWRNAPSIDEIVAEIEARESGEIGADDYVPFF